MKHHRALLGIAVFVAAALLEWALYVRRDKPYPWREALAALGVSTGNRLSNLLTAAVHMAGYSALYRFRVVDISVHGVLAWVGVIMAVDFLYYWHHRASHGVRWLWASHAVHHRAERITLSTAMQLPWFSFISLAWLFWLPLALLGVPLYAVGIALGLNLFYQFWLHTEAIGRLGPIEWIFNTPSHHRVHHGANAGYLDKNFGGILIVFDHLFGTFAEELEPCRYGIPDRPSTYNPLRIAFDEWAHLLRDVRRAPTWRGRLAVCFRSPSAAMPPAPLVAERAHHSSPA